MLNKKIFEYTSISDKKILTLIEKVRAKKEKETQRQGREGEKDRGKGGRERNFERGEWRGREKETGKKGKRKREIL